MKAMKSMNMNRMLGSLKRKPSEEGAAEADTPEGNVKRNVQLFCESGGPNGGGDEVLYLPTIVESCESSPAAAKDAAYMIRKYLSKDNFSKPYVQYNGIMLIRILADNPGKTFTRNFDQKFVDAIKELLRVGRDPSVKQILMETLDTFQRTKTEDEGLALLNAMWKKEHDRMVKIHGPGGPRPPPATFDNSQNYFSRSRKTNRLPPPHELSSRIEEARTSAGLLSQVTQSTPPSEILTNELVREFADRCQSASRSIQAYMVAENPSPDNDTMETLIETNEQLGKAMSQHQRAVLAARKAAGLGGGEGNTPPAIIQESYAPNGPSRAVAYTAPSGPPPGRKAAPKIPPPGDYAPTGSDDGDEDPFKDPKSKERSLPFPKDQASSSGAQFHDQLGVEPYHPGFRETQSYMGRQDSSLGKVTMRGALDGEEEEPVSAVSASSAAKSAQPMYRY